MSFQNDTGPDMVRSLRRLMLVLVSLCCIAIFAFWRIDNDRVELVRMQIIDRFVPSFDWTIRPVAALTGMVSDFRSYARIYEQNQELRRELQRMQSWREAALQLEQKNARLLALNNVRLNPRLTFVTGEVLSDAGSPFRRSSLVNIGRSDGVVDGAAVLDGLGVVGRVAGVGENASRILFLTDSNSRVPAIVRPSGQRAIVSGDNTGLPTLDFVENAEALRPGDRVVTSGDGGLFPPDLLIGQVVVGPDGRQRVRPAADYRQLDFVRVVHEQPTERIDTPGSPIGPTVMNRLGPDLLPETALPPEAAE